MLIRLTRLFNADSSEPPIYVSGHVFTVVHAATLVEVSQLAIGSDFVNRNGGPRIGQRPCDARLRRFAVGCGVPNYRIRRQSGA